MSDCRRFWRSGWNLVDHASGNLRALDLTAAELLTAGAQGQLAELDEKLFFWEHSLVSPEKSASPELGLGVSWLRQTNGDQIWRNGAGLC